jgi:ribosome assembly protein 1
LAQFRTQFATKLAALFDAAGGVWVGAADRVCALGPRHVGANVLLSVDTMLAARSEFAKLYRREVYLQQQHKAAGLEGAAAELSAFGNSIVLAFQLLTQAGPLCEEPMLGVAFELEAVEVTSEGSSQDAGFSGQVISAAKEAFRVVSCFCRFCCFIILIN